MGVNLRLQLLKLGLLGSDLLLIHLMNQLLNPLQHMVEVVIYIIEFILIAVIEPDTQITHLHSPEGSNQPPHRLMNKPVYPVRENYGEQQSDQRLSPNPVAMLVQRLQHRFRRNKHGQSRSQQR